MDPYIESFIKKVQFHRYRFFHGSKRKVMTHQKCIKSFILYRGTGFARGKINLGTLEVLELHGKLRGKDEMLNHRIMDKKIASINERNEFRSFFAFLKKEYPEDYPRIPFIKTERPDFILRYNKELVGIEITEAIHGSDAKRRSKIYESSLGREKGRIIEPYGQWTSRQKSGKSSGTIDKLIDRRVRDKKEKFKDFQPVDREILVILANHQDFEGTGDAEKVRRLLERKGAFHQAPFSIVVMNLAHGFYAHYRWKKGKVILSNGGKGKK